MKVNLSTLRAGSVVPLPIRLASCAVAMTIVFAAATVGVAATKAEYHDPRAMVAALKTLESSSARVELHELALTHGERKIRMLEIAPEGKRPGQDLHDHPAILVVGNPLGTTPLAGEAALQLAELAIAATADNIDTAAAARARWYIIPSSNPEGAEHFFDRPLHHDGRNLHPVDEDRDGEFGEDPVNDLIRDGIIASMLVPDPQGEWLLTDDDPPLPRKANPSRDERGLYDLATEGRDDDGDGRYNEDGPGGVVPGLNFPHGFVHWRDEAGRWAASEPASRAILHFAFAHPEIAMVLVFGASNTLAQVPEPDTVGANPQQKYKVRSRMARRIGIDAESQFSIAQLLALRREQTGDTSLTVEDILPYLDVDPPTGPSPRDCEWWRVLGERYREVLTDAGLDGPRIDPLPTVAGSVEGWAYFQFGVPTFALDFWSVPGPAPVMGAAGMSIGDTTAVTGVAPGQQAEAASPDSTAAAQAAGPDPDLQALVAFSSEQLGDAGYLPWQEITLPDGLAVLVGGEVPFARRTPPAAYVDSLLSRQLPFVLELPAWLPELALGAPEVVHVGARVYDVTVQVGNNGRLPYPTAQGARCRRPPPVVVTLEGAEVLEQRARQVVKQVPAMSAAPVRWLVRGKAGTQVEIRASAPGLGTVQLAVDLERQGGQR